MAASDDATFKLVKAYEIDCMRSRDRFYTVAECLRAPKAVFLGRMIIRLEQRIGGMKTGARTRRAAGGARVKRATRKK